MQSLQALKRLFLSLDVSKAAQPSGVIVCNDFRGCQGWITDGRPSGTGDPHV